MFGRHQEVLSYLPQVIKEKPASKLPCLGDEIRDQLSTIVPENIINCGICTTLSKVIDEKNRFMKSIKYAENDLYWLCIESGRNVEL
jgi:hypothetical protein